MLQYSNWLNKAALNESREIWTLNIHHHLKVWYNDYIFVVFERCLYAQQACIYLITNIAKTAYSEIFFFVLEF